MPHPGEIGVVLTRLEAILGLRVGGALVALVVTGGVLVRIVCRNVGALLGVVPVGDARESRHRRDSRSHDD